MKTYDFPAFEILAAEHDGRCVHEWRNGAKFINMRHMYCRKCPATYVKNTTIIGDEPPAIDNPITGTIDSLVNWAVEKLEKDGYFWYGIDYDEDKVEVYFVKNMKQGESFVVNLKDHPDPATATRAALCEALAKAIGRTVTNANENGKM